MGVRAEVGRFRCWVFRNGSEVLLQSKSGQPLGRYFPELREALRQLPHNKFVLDGETVVFRDKCLSFDDLLMHIHPAESRICKLAKEAPPACQPSIYWWTRPPSR